MTNDEAQMTKECVFWISVFAVLFDIWNLTFDIIKGGIYGCKYGDRI